MIKTKKNLRNWKKTQISETLNTYLSTSLDAWKTKDETNGIQHDSQIWDWIHEKLAGFEETQWRKKGIRRERVSSKTNSGREVFSKINPKSL